MSFLLYLLRLAKMRWLLIGGFAIVGILTLLIHPLLFLIWILYLIYFSIRRVTLAVPDMFMLALIVISVFLIVIPEFFYAKDIYPAHFRANTMFKLVYQSFMMLSLFSGYALFRLLYVVKKWK